MACEFANAVGRPVYGSRPFRDRGFIARWSGICALPSTIGGTFTDVVLEVGGRRLTAQAADPRRKRPEEAVSRRGTADPGRLLDEALAMSPCFVARHDTGHECRHRNGAAARSTGAFLGPPRVFPRHPSISPTKAAYDQYDLTIEKPQARLVAARRLRFQPCPSAWDVHGKVRLGAPTKGAVHALRQATRGRGAIESLAGSLHAFLRQSGAREGARPRRILKAELPDLWLTLSSEVCPRGAGVMSAPRPRWPMPMSSR